MEIVGLNNFVRDDINKLIAKFVGYQSKVAKEIKDLKLKWLNLPWEEERRERPYRFGEWLREETWKNTLNRIMNRELDRLRKIKSIKQRKAEFLKLPYWKRLFLLKEWWFYLLLFPKNNSNLRFLNVQRCVLGYETAIRWL